MPIPDFERDLRDVILRSLPLSGKSAKGRSELEIKPTSNLLITYFNWKERYVHPHPRVIYRSRLLQASSLYSENIQAVEKLLSKIERGDLIDSHLSSGVRFGWEPGGKKSKRDFDLMLNDWGIHHLHLGDGVGRTGFVNRERNSLQSDNLLAVIFRAGQAFALDLIHHGEWAVKRLVETAVESWPDSELFLSVQGIMPWQDKDDTNCIPLRNVGMPSPIVIGNGVYISSTVMSTARTTLQAAMRAKGTIRNLAYLESNLKDLELQSRNAAAHYGVEFPLIPEFRVVEASYPQWFGFAILEASSKMIIGIHGNSVPTSRADDQ